MEQNIYASLAFSWLNRRLIPRLGLALLLVGLMGPLYAQFQLPTGGGTDTLTGVVAGTLTDDGGAAGAYAEDYQGALTLVPNPGNVITLTFTSMNMESPFDYIMVYDGPNTTFPPILCATSGTALPPVVTGTNNDGMTIVLISDGSLSLAGFQATVSASPGGSPGAGSNVMVPLFGEQLVRTCTGNVFDAGGPTCNYPASQGVGASTGSLRIEPATPGQVVRLNFNAFRTERNLIAPHPDGLMVYDGPKTTDPLLAELNELPTTALIADNGPVANASGALTLQFYSDFFIQDEGFQAAISCVDRPQAVISGGTTVCEGQTVNLTVNFTAGTGPFSLVYTNGLQTVTVPSITTSPYTFSVTPPIGSYEFRLVSIADANLTRLRPLTTPSSTTVTVIDKPTATMLSTAVTTCPGKNATIPISFNGQPPFSLIVNDGTADLPTITGIASTSFNLVVSPTVTTNYTIRSVGNTQCGFVPATPSSTLVNVLETTAALSVVGSARVCPGGTKQLRVDFTGTGPWDFTYTDNGTSITVPGVTANPYFFTVTPVLAGDNTYAITAVQEPGCAPGSVVGSGAVVRVSTPVAVAASATVNCADGAGTITADASGGTPMYVYSFDGGRTFDLSNTAFRPVSPVPYTVVARDRDGCIGTTSVILDGVTAPTITSIDNITSSSMRVNWVSLVPGARYTLRYRIQGSALGWTEVRDLISTSLIVNFLNPGTTYEFQVKIVCSESLQSLWSNLASARTLFNEIQSCAVGSLFASPTPTGLVLTDITATTATVCWNSVDGPGYILSFGPETVNPLSWTQVNVCNTRPLGPRNCYNITGLTPSLTYRVRIRTNCSNCTSSLQNNDRRSRWTSAVEFRTLRLRADESPVNGFGGPALTLYPNPNRGQFTARLHASEAQAAQIEVLSMAGQLVYQQSERIQEGENDIAVSLPGVAPGLYFFRIRSIEGDYSAKIMVE
jgi:hypothetical protein